MTAIAIMERSKAYVRPLVILTIAGYGRLSFQTSRGTYVDWCSQQAASLAVLRMLMRTPSDLLSAEKFKDAIFGQLWLIIGSTSGTSPMRNVDSMLQCAQAPSRACDRQR